MRIHPLLDDPQAVLVSHAPVTEPVQPADYRAAAQRVLSALQVTLAGEKVVLKPNVTAGEHHANPDSGIGTHPAFVGGLIDYLAGRGARPGGIYIVEDPRDTDDNHPRHWRGTGFDELAYATGVRLRCPTTYTCVRRPVPQPQAFSHLNVSRLAVAPDSVLINVPKLKTHNLAITTLCLKNLMGLVNVFDRHYCGQAWRELVAAGVLPESEGRPREAWMDERIHAAWQEGLARRLVDTAQVICPHLNIVEGVVGREGTGFQRGRNFPLGLAIAGVNMVAVDTVASYLMGFDPARLVYLQYAAAAGLGSNDLAQLRVYVVEDGTVVPCPDVEALRARPPLRVIRNIVGEPDVS
jgi:uncharacterized protein (DUF362 family)